MAVPTFKPPIPPSPGTMAKPELRLIKTEFGDGYTQRTRDGLNHSRDSLSLTWELLTPEQGRKIDAFFRERGGDRPFYYHSVLHDGPVKWTCTDYSPKIVENGFWSYSATLTQDFGLEV